MRSLLGVLVALSVLSSCVFALDDPQKHADFEPIVFVDCTRGVDTPDCGENAQSGCASITGGINSSIRDNAKGLILSILPGVCSGPLNHSFNLTSTMHIAGSGHKSTFISFADIWPVEGIRIFDVDIITFSELSFSGYRYDMMKRSLINIDHFQKNGQLIIADCSFTGVTDTILPFEDYPKLFGHHILHYRPLPTEASATSSILIQSSLFTDNHLLAFNVSSNIRLQSCELEQNPYRLFTVYAGNLVLAGTTIKFCSDLTSIILIDGASKLNITSSEMSHNTAPSIIYSAAAPDPFIQPSLFISKSTFYYNEGVYLIHGPAMTTSVIDSEFDSNRLTLLYITNSDLLVTRSFFSNNFFTQSPIVYEAIGSGIDPDPVYFFSVTNCTFTDNYAETGAGGCIRMVAMGGNKQIVGNITDSLFESNKGTYGGSIFMAGNIDCTFQNTTFKENTASDDGGAIYCAKFQSTSTIYFTSSNNFEDNRVISGNGPNIFTDGSSQCDFVCDATSVYWCFEVGIPRVVWISLELIVLFFSCTIALTTIITFYFHWMQRIRNSAIISLD